jgi:tRNA G10  N-methylase Trm11
MSNLNFAAEKLGRALYHLVGTGTHQKRLHFAFTSFRPLQLDDFNSHPKLKKSYEDIMRRLMVVKDDQKDDVPTKLEKMTNEEAVELTEMLVDLYVLTEAARCIEKSKPATGNFGKDQ